ncbi:MAG: hypothetical protein ACK4SF_00310 [Algoriphagus aquaeductus]|uniref:hypothetical protein n=1 Tax=Algoriphagus aquaeductus TaxID=475299 RepID=UPI00391881BC
MEALIGAIQLAVSLLQMKFDYFKNGDTVDEEINRQIDSLGEAIRVLEYALSETVATLRTRRNRPNNYLADLWERVSNKFNELGDNVELVDISFKKNLYWRNPQQFQGAELYEISIDNVLGQLRILRTKYDNLLKKRNR